MPNLQQPFQIDVRTGWVDYSPALYHHAYHRIRSRLAAFASEIQSVLLRISDAAPQDHTLRRCDVEVMTRNAGRISMSSAGADLFKLIDATVDGVGETLQERFAHVPNGERRQRVA